MNKIGYVEWYDAVERILSSEDYKRLLYSTGQEYLAIKKDLWNYKRIGICYLSYNRR